MIVHRTNASMVLCYVDHHDKAYSWAERRRLEAHPVTGAAQLVEFQETVQEIVVPRHVEAPPCGHLSDEELLRIGVPEDWLSVIRAADEDQLLSIAERLPTEAAEALLRVAAGGSVPIPETLSKPTLEESFQHRDAQQRFRVVDGVEELQRALDRPWDKWLVFLHPDQRSLVEQDWNGPARVRGSAGTGKTVVAVHRAVHLARRNTESRVLLVTFSDILARYLSEQLKRLVGNEPRVAERIDVDALSTVARRLWHGHSVADESTIATILDRLCEHADALPVTCAFVKAEWRHVVDQYNLTDWEKYRDFRRIGRKTRLSESRRQALWSIYTQLREELSSLRLVPEGAAMHALAREFRDGRNRPYQHIVADEAQDISPAELVFLAALAGSGTNRLFFAGDTAQRIFRQPFSWSRQGVDVRGRSAVLRVNYRTSHQIRSAADRLLDSAIEDPDGDEERRDGVVSVFNGPPPEVAVCRTVDDETDRVADWLDALIAEEFEPATLAVVVRSDAQMERAKLAANRVDSWINTMTMHEAKGSEFRAVAVIACDDEVIPSQERIEHVGDEADLEEVYVTERNLLYVACTRARERLLVSGVIPASEFLDDFDLRSQL
ncbi:MAG: 3'-5' exonuclease [bacterium]